MKTLTICLFVILLSAASMTFAENQTRLQVTAQVHGMVCEFCAIGLEKQFKKRSEVANIEVSLEQGTVLLEFKPGQQLSDDVITKIITDNGINVESITPAAES